MNATWPHVVHMFLQRYLNDEVLQSAYDSVARAKKGGREDELQFAQHVMTAARRCLHVFTPSDLVQSYVMGLTESVRRRVQNQLRFLSPQDRNSMIVIRQIAHQEGQSQRTMRLAGHSPVPPPRGSKVTPKTTAVIGTAPGSGGTPLSDTWMTTYAAPVTPSSLPQADISILQADAAVNAVLALTDVYGPDKLE